MIVNTMTENELDRLTVPTELDPKADESVLVVEVVAVRGAFRLGSPRILSSKEIDMIQCARPMWRRRRAARARR